MRCIPSSRSIGALLGVLGAACAFTGGSPAPKRLDPADWGRDHVGKPVPEYVTGDECLFCHRSDIGPSWSRNRHQRTIREPAANDGAVAALQKSRDFRLFARDVTLILGGVHSTRFLRRSTEYGKLDLLTVARDAPAVDRNEKLRLTDGTPRWDQAAFAESCAGCHATGVDPATKSFATAALDCYVCHGPVALEHSKDRRLVLLSKKRQDPGRVVISICASCHVRTGKSKSTGLPYPANFVPGDNLFRDFQVDFSPPAFAVLNPADRHVLENIRDVAILGKDELTCLTCHSVHPSSARKHARLPTADSCLTCHQAVGPKKVRAPFEVHSKTCQY